MHVFTDANFKEEVLDAKVPVLVDFWAPWCGPCQRMLPTMEELAHATEGKEVKIGKLNVDESPDTAESYGIMSIPTFIVFQNGQVAKQLQGVQSKEALLAALGLS